MAGTTNYFGISYPTSTDYVKDGATAMQTIATGFDTAVAIPVYNNQTGTSYTFVLADAAKVVSSNNASGVTFTIPPQSSVAWATGTTLTVINYGAGDLTVAGGSGVTVTNASSTVAQYRGASIIRTASDAWTLVPLGGGASPISVSYVVVGGGGAGGATNHGSLSIGGGGGGAGGYLSGSVDINKAVAYSVQVGAGGASTFQWQSNGGTSQFFSIAAAGGGEGASMPAGSPSPASAGASGGGGCYNQSGAAGISGQGYAGGNSGNSSGNGSGGGGGGSASVGGNGSTGVTGTVGAGGTGTASSITGSSVTRATGGSGGRSNFTYNGSSGTANTGNGGEGSGLYAGGNSAGGAGGSGIVIISYPNSLTITASAGLTTSTSTVGSNKVTSITAGVGTVTFN